MLNSANPIAIEFTRFVLQSQPNGADFQAIYDAMSRAAVGRQFRDLGLQELGQVGISFSLLATADLEALIEQARQTLENDVFAQV